MGQRVDLQAAFESLLGNDHVYFQPPSSIELQYPCIIYERSNIAIRFADNKPYKHTKRYSVMLIYRDPDSSLPDKILELPLVSFDRHYTADNLHHDVFSLYF